MPTKQATRLTHRLRKYLELGAKLLNMSDDEHVERAMSAKRLMEKIWAKIDWDDYLVDVLFENGNFTAVVYDREANLYAIPIVFDGDDIEFGEWVRVTESFEIVPVADSDETATRSLQNIKRGSIQVFRSGGKRYFVSRACTAVMNRVGEIDSRELFDTFIERFNNGDGDFPTPYFTLRHMGQAYRMGEITFLARDGFVLTAVGIFDDDNGLADAAYESLERDADYWGTSQGFGLTDNDPPPEIMNVTYRSGDDDIEFPIPVYNRGYMIELSLLAEKDAAAYFTNISRMEVFDTMPQSRKRRSLKDDLLKLFPDNPDLVDDVVAGNAGVNDLVSERGLIARSATADLDDDETDEIDDADTGEIDDVELDDDLAGDLADALVNNPAFVDAVASRLEREPDAAGTTDDDVDAPTIREMLAQLIVDGREMRRDVDALLQGHDDRIENRQSRSVRLRRKETGNRPRDRYDSTRERAADDPDDDFDDGEFEVYYNELAADL